MNNFKHEGICFDGAMKKIASINERLEKIEAIQKRAILMKSKKEDCMIWLVVRAEKIQRYQEPLSCSYKIVPKEDDLWSQEFLPPLGYFSSKAFADKACSELNGGYAEYVVLPLEQEK